MKQKIILIASIVIGLLAFWLTHQYIQGERARLFADAEQITILAATRDLTAGTVLKPDDLGQKTVYRKYGGTSSEYILLSEANVSKILGKKLRYSLVRKDSILWSNVDMPQGRRGGLAPILRPGMRAISVAVGGDSAVSGLVQPNDRVDILGTFTFPARNSTNPASRQTENVTLTLLQDVSVLATGMQLAKQEFEDAQVFTRPGGYSTVTFEVTPREAELLVFAQNVQGRLTLSLRNPEDVSFERDLPEVNFEHIEKKLPELNLYRQKNIRHKTELQ